MDRESLTYMAPAVKLNKHVETVSRNVRDYLVAARRWYIAMGLGDSQAVLENHQLLSLIWLEMSDSERAEADSLVEEILS